MATYTRQQVEDKARSTDPDTADMLHSLLADREKRFAITHTISATLNEHTRNINSVYLSAEKLRTAIENAVKRQP